MMKSKESRSLLCVEYTERIKDIIWFLKGYITAKRWLDSFNKEADFCLEHIRTLEFAMQLIKDYFSKFEEGEDG